MRIVLVTDTHLADRVPAFQENWRLVADWMRTLRPDLIVHLGDITLDGAGREEDLVEAHRLFVDLPAPMRLVPGNHDIGDNPLQAGMPIKHPFSPDRLVAYRRLFGSDHWSMDAEGWQLVGLNAQLFLTGSAEEAEQDAFLASILPVRSEPLGLFLHKPLFRTSWEDREEHIRYVPEPARQRLARHLDGRDLRFVVCGHTHQARSLRVDGVEHAWIPSAAFYLPDVMQERIGEKPVAAAVLELTSLGHRLEIVEVPRLPQRDILDHPETYPEIAAARVRFGRAEPVAS